MPSSLVSSYFHLVFSTKERRRLILPEWEPRLHSYLGGIVKGMEAIPLTINGIEDKIHSLVRLKSKHRLDYFLRDLKGDSSEWVHKEVTRVLEWQKGYAAFRLVQRRFRQCRDTSQIRKSAIVAWISNRSTLICCRRAASSSMRDFSGSSAAVSPRQCGPAYQTFHVWL